MNRNSARLQQGFTLVEMLVSVTIFAFVIVAVYYFFDRGQWVYLHSQRRANLQENGRLTLEELEREMRMISFGVPTGTQIGSETSWLPAVFDAEVNRISFRGDIDNFTSLVTSDVASGAASLPVASDPDDIACNEDPGLGAMILVERGRNWAPFTCSVPDPSVNSIDITPAAAQDFAAAEIEIFSPEHVFYRLTPDTDGDGVCDNTTDYSQCKIERAVVYSNTPVTPTDITLDWETFATNISKFQLEYFYKDDPPGELTTVPLTGTDLAIVDMIRINLEATDRADVFSGGARTQTIPFTTDILIRKRKF